MRMQRAHIRIGELAKRVGVERFVIRFWEKEFKLKSPRSIGGQRFYTPRELETFKAIKDLLYHQKFTIEGAKRVLKETKNNNLFVGSQRTSLNLSPDKDVLYKKLRTIRDQLMAIRQLI
jgi:DNA-binding transcriptional MerR regulator